MKINHNQQTIILAIESSCDDTSVAISCNDKMLANVVLSQTIHSSYGGVVPELASRAHLKHIVWVCEKALDEAKITKQQVDAVAYTRGPGLLGALMVGAHFAKGLALAWQKPLIDINHMEAHVMAHFIRDSADKKMPELPMLCLTVSGGHTQLVLVRDNYAMQVIGSTIDDAAGEAFDKGAKLLGLPYPGGKEIDALAKNYHGALIELPIPKIAELNFSFSGIKTAFLYHLQKQCLAKPNYIASNLPMLAASLQKTIIAHLIEKTKLALQVDNTIKSLALAGGVSANSGLRSAGEALAKLQDLPIFVPPLQYCTDNAAMIARAAFEKWKAGIFCPLEAPTLARMPAF